MVNKEFLKEKNLLEAHKQFMRLCEWSYVPQTLEEDGDEENDTDQPNMNNYDSNDNNNVDSSSNMSQDTNNDGMGMDSNSMNQDNVDNNMGSDTDVMGNEHDMMGNDQDMSNPQMPNQSFGNGIMDDEIDDEEVIDVDDITNAQEKMNNKVNHVGKELGNVDDKIESLLSYLEKMEQMINKNNDEIASFKQEFEKRNPTQTEKLNLRSLDSYPFNVNPKEYWKNKENEYASNYSGYGDNSEPTTDEYRITNSDVDDFNEREIDKSFEIDDDWKQDFNKIFGI